MRVLLLSTIIFLSSISYAQEFKPKAAFDVFPNSFRIKTDNRVMKIGDYRVRLGIDFKWKDLILSGDSHTYMDFAHNRKRIAFSPKLCEFYVGARYNYKGVSISYKHLCIHPVKVDGSSDTNIYGGYDMFSISYNY